MTTKTEFLRAYRDELITRYEWARDPESAAERCRCPDGPRYRACGNAVTTTVVEWLGHRLYPVMTDGR